MVTIKKSDLERTGRRHLMALFALNVTVITKDNVAQRPTNVFGVDKADILYETALRQRWEINPSNREMDRSSLLKLESMLSCQAKQRLKTK
jgi:hypothetical protein